MDENSTEATVEPTSETVAPAAPASKPVRVRKPRAAAKPKADAAPKPTAEEAVKARADRAAKAKAAAEEAKEQARIQALLRTGQRRAPGGNGVVILNRVGATRQKGHGLRDHGPSPGGGRTYFCRCGVEEGFSKTLIEARNKHQSHLGLGLKTVPTVAPEGKPKVEVKVTPAGIKVARKRQNA
jgi:hypothetical protein